MTGETHAPREALATIRRALKMKTFPRAQRSVWQGARRHPTSPSKNAATHKKLGAEAMGPRESLVY